MGNIKKKVCLVGYFIFKLEDVMSELTGKIIDGRYRITEVIGKGGMSVVYKAINLSLEKEWAIKEIKIDPNSPMDFLAEPNILKNLDHPSLPRIVDIISEENKIYIVLDYIDGTSLNLLLNQYGAFPEKKVIDWAKDLCDVIGYLHNQKPNPIIYRDMKPGNVMLTKQGKIKLIDFGIAREYKESTQADTVVIGTRGYAAPEQYGNHQTDVRTDIYSLGVTLYHLVTGTGPNDPPYEILPIRNINSKLSEGLEYIILKCTQQDPNRRYQNIEELLEDLENVGKLSAQYKIMQRRKKGKYFVAAFVLSLAITLSGFLRINSVEKNQYLAVIEKGKVLEEQQNHDEAAKTMKEAIDKIPGRDEGYIELAKLYYNISENDKMIELLQIEAPSRDENIEKNEEYHYWLGLACFVKSDYKGAQENFDKVTKTDFDGIQYYKAISKAFNKPGSLNKDDEAIKSVDQLKQYIEQQTDEGKRVRGYLLLSNLYRDNPQVFENSEDQQIALLEKVKSQSKDKGNYAIYENLGQSYYNKALEVADNDEEYTKYLNKALENYKILDEMGYSTSTIYKNIGTIYKALKNYDKAESNFIKLVNNYPNDFKGYLELAKFYYEMESKKNPGERNYSKFAENYLLAEKNNTVENNYELARIKTIYKELQSQGYVK